jgi:acyl-CoA thioesterase II
MMQETGLADLGADTAVSGRDGRYTATLSESWEIWGPQGGYVAAIALRAAGAESAFPRPASFVCHYLRRATAGLAEIHVKTIRRAKRAESLRVTVVQDDAPVLDGLVWTVEQLEGVDHDATRIPLVPPAEHVEPLDMQRWGDMFPHSFWRNFDLRPVAPHPSEWNEAREPRGLVWARLRERPPLEDPFMDSARMLTVVDAFMFPAATFAHDELFPYLAPSLDLAMSFHAREAGSDWLLIDAYSPLSAGAVVGGQASIWSADGRLLASAMQQMLQRT